MMTRGFLPCRRSTKIKPNLSNLFSARHLIRVQPESFHRDGCHLDRSPICLPVAAQDVEPDLVHDCLAASLATTDRPSLGTAIVPQPRCEPINAGLMRTQRPI